MKCPVDQVDLVMADRQGVEIDYCPRCRGIWLDRGELDRIIERSADREAAPSRGETDDRRGSGHGGDKHGGFGGRGRRRSWLSEIFD
jgi:Zn-finger nucleic acid-binding protein